MEYDVPKLYPVNVDPEKTIFSFGIPVVFDNHHVYEPQEILQMNDFGLFKRLDDVENRGRKYYLFSKNIEGDKEIGRKLLEEVQTIRKKLMNVLETPIEEFEANKHIDDYWRVLLKLSKDLSEHYNSEDFCWPSQGPGHGPHVRGQLVQGGRLVVRVKTSRLEDLGPRVLDVARVLDLENY